MAIPLWLCTGFVACLDNPLFPLLSSLPKSQSQVLMSAQDSQRNTLKILQFFLIACLSGMFGEMKLASLNARSHASALQLVITSSDFSKQPSLSRSPVIIMSAAGKTTPVFRNFNTVTIMNLISDSSSYFLTQCF